MKKVINYLGLRKVAINVQLDKLPADVNQYVAEVGAELEEELRQIDQALLVLSNVVGRSELLMDFIQWKNKKDNNWLKHIDDKEVDDYLKSINCH